MLPKPLRRPARFLARLGKGDVEMPRYGATMMTLGLFLATGLYGAILGGHMPQTIQAVSSRSGFAIANVRVTGNVETSDIDVLERVGLDGWTSLVGFNASDARERLATLPWVEAVTVRKVYPETLEVAIVERKPYAIWQRGNDLTLVEIDGRVIGPFSGNRHATLPLIIGAGAPELAPSFIARVATFPELASRVKAYVRVSDRRWDVHLTNGVQIKLPETGQEQAIADVIALDKQSGLLSRDIAAVDLRFPDRLVVRLTADAAMRRDEALVEAGRKPKPTGQNT